MWGTERQRKAAEYIAAAVAVVAVVIMALTHWGFFSDPKVAYSRDSSVWDYLFGDQPTLGLVRLAIFATGVFLIASLAALLVASRWISAGGGLKADDAQKVATASASIDEQQHVIDELRAEIGTLKDQRDTAVSVATGVIDDQQKLIDDFQRELRLTTAQRDEAVALAREMQEWREQHEGGLSKWVRTVTGR